MKNFKNPSLNKATSDMQLSIDQCFEAMKPYLDILESENGILAKNIVSLVALDNLMGVANAEEFEVAIQEASSVTGIPKESFQLYAKSTIAMFECFKLLEMK